MKIITRAQWGAAPAHGLVSNPLGTDSTLYVHWSTGRFAAIDTVEEAKASVRGIQAYHQGTKGWADIGYSYLVVQARGQLERALILEGRLFRNVPAAQEGHNTANGAVCVLMGEGEQLLDGTLAALRQVYAHFPGRKLGGHRDVGSTECPGDKLYAHLSEIRRAPKRKPYLP